MVSSRFLNAGGMVPRAHYRGPFGGYVPGCENCVAISQASWMQKLRIRKISRSRRVARGEKRISCILVSSLRKGNQNIFRSGRTESSAEERSQWRVLGCP